ncbi:unnamed protein product [Thelazia callipaeda]|uniref:GOLD domain-containing protein n=1 Tax=Thelazia callipaeda TaxID=103827 RepID=A0A158RB78_THECL|nr:unnamed protein product [Thelazia callipaeda]
MDLNWILVCIFSLLLFYGSETAEYAYTIEVAAGRYSCFFQTVNNTRHKYMEVDYQVVDGSDLNINFVMKFESVVLLQEERKVEGSHKFAVNDSGDYELCFDNTFSYQARKLLFFEVYLLDEDGNFDETNMVEEFDSAKQEYTGLGFEMQKFQSASNSIKNRLNKIEYHQSLLRAYEARDRAIMNANFERVTLWSVVNSVVLIAVGLLQECRRYFLFPLSSNCNLVMISYSLLFIFISAYLITADEFAHSVIIPAGKTDCYGFTISNPKYRTFEVDYQVITGGELDIRFFITSPKGVRIVDDAKKSDGSHRIDLSMENAGYGDYLFCFDNEFSIQSDKRVSFKLFLLDADGHFLGNFDQSLSVDAEVLRTLDTHISNFQNVTTNVKNNLNIIERLQRQYATIELADRAAVEHSYEMINFWSVVHLCVMLFSLTVQVYMVRSLFEDGSKVGYILRKGGK